MMLLVILAIAAVACVPGAEPTAQLRTATGQYTTTEKAMAAGYTLVPKLDHCFNNPGVGAMGFHYINTSALDTKVNETAPEAIVYAPQTDGSMKLAAVEFIVPAANWDGEGHTSPPIAYGKPFHLNKDLGVYVLHAWLFEQNPKGLFEDWNPNVTCPTAMQGEFTSYSMPGNSVRSAISLPDRGVTRRR
jgi:hypothetical protein